MVRLSFACVAAAVAVSGFSTRAGAMPVGPSVFCDTYDESETSLCSSGLPDCTLCHTNPPIHNAYGAAVSAALLPGEPRPLTVAAYTAGLPDALAAVENDDSDGDGYSNLEEIAAGSFPGDPASNPGGPDCPPPGANPWYDVCHRDRPYVYKKVVLDVCGQSPSYEELQSFRALSEAAQDDAIHAALATCLDSEFWIGKNGQLWQLAHRKIRPVGSLKFGEDQGSVPVSDYYDDYNLFVWTQTDDHDVRAVLLADYFVARTANPTTYAVADELPTQKMQLERRAGMLTTDWVMIYNIMFTAVPRTAAAQAYRAFLGYDLARMEGLYPVEGEPVDYDDKGVAAETCAVCHSTIDPLTYPWTRYNGLQAPRAMYDPLRIIDDFADEGENILAMPEAGYIFGQPVDDLMEWAQVAANSAQFASATVGDYWKLLNGVEPAGADEAAEHLELADGLAGIHEYSVERMLHALIETEAYGVP